MAKDKIGYRIAKRFSHGEQSKENAIGISSLFRADVASASDFDYEELLEQRPNALIKWSFDDFCVEEVLPTAVTQLSHSNSSACSCLLTVVSEGIPVATLQRIVKGILSPNTTFHFLSPIDFISCSKRFIWIREEKRAVEQKFMNKKQMRSKDGVVFFTDLVEIPLPAVQSHFPAHFLPDITYTILLRNVSGCLGSVLEPLRSISRGGFLNYSHSARHGLSLLHCFDDAKLLLHREYRAFLKNYVQSLSENTFYVKREMNSLLHLLDDNKSVPSDWNSMRESISKATQLDHFVVSRHNTGLYHPHHKILNRFVDRAADLFPKHNDAAEVLRESISTTVLEEKLRSITDIAFNMMATARWNLFGSRVVVGDVVSVDPKWEGDKYEAFSDRLSDWTTSVVEREWFSLAVREGAYHCPEVKVVRTAQEAQAYSIYDVVLPLYGRNFHKLERPKNGTDDVFNHLVSELEIQGLPQMAGAPEGHYRHLVRTAKNASFYIMDEDRGWDWMEDDGSKALKQRLYRDQEGIIRMKSPLHACSPRNVIARPGIRTAEERRDFLKPAKKKGMTCIFQGTLPRGTPITTLLREVFRFSTLSAAGVVRILR